MQAFPKTPDYSGLNAPIGEEYDLKSLAIAGDIPDEVQGSFFRATPDPTYAPFIDDSAAALSGDGMISVIRIVEGHASFSMRFVNTARHQAEVAAGRALFGKYRNRFTDRPEAAGLDRTVANTTPVWHAGRLLMTKEDGRPYRVDPHTLETMGSYDFGGKLRSKTMTAHVRIDSRTGELFFFGYEADGDASTKVAYCVVDRDGSLVSEQWFDAPYCALMHDFAITENFVLFPIYPTTSDLVRLRAGGDHWLHEMTRDSWVGVMPRYGSVSQMRWFRGPRGVFCYHMMNAFEDAAGRIQFDQCLSNANGLPFIRKASGLNLDQAELGSRLARWTIDLNNGSEEVSETVVGPPGDFPVIPAYAQGRPYTHAWMLTMNPQMQGPPVEGGPAGAMFNMLLRLDFAGGPPQAFELPPAHCINEPVLVPARHAMHDGWLLAVVDQQLGPAEFRHAVWIFEAGRLAAGPVARISIPHRLRPQVHGWWVSAAELAAA